MLQRGSMGYCGWVWENNIARKLVGTAQFTFNLMFHFFFLSSSYKHDKGAWASNFHKSLTSKRQYNWISLASVFLSVKFYPTPQNLGLNEPWTPPGPLHCHQSPHCFLRDRGGPTSCPVLEHGHREGLAHAGPMSSLPDAKLNLASSSCLSNVHVKSFQATQMSLPFSIWQPFTHFESHKRL